MSYPNVPLGTTEWQRKIAQAINYLLNKIWFFDFIVHDQPDPAEQIILRQWPTSLPLVTDLCSAWAGTAPSSDAVFSINIDGLLAGTITFSAGEQAGVVALTTTTIPADTDFEIVAPTPQDATLADITLTLAASI